MRLIRYSSALVLILWALTAAAQKPKVSNGKWQEEPAGTDLKATVNGLVQKQAGPLWIGYKIPAATKERIMCCFDDWDQAKNFSGCCGGCRVGEGKGVSFKRQK